MTTNIMGTWTPYSTTISVEEHDVFKKVIGGIVGVQYSPLCVSTQLVSGTNYRFFCNAKGVYPNALNEVAIVQIYKPLNGEAHLTSITRV
jgi:hypothetical protein